VEKSAYRRLGLKGLLKRAEQAFAMLRDCTVCAQACRVNRLRGELGICRAGRYPVVSSYGPHFGEEAPLVGKKGSGTIFFTHCNLRCEFCQNCDISQEGKGEEISAAELANLMLHLQGMGCHNINLVSPSHYVPQILEALVLATLRGLKIPVVYNTGVYDSLKTLALLDGVVDIYMPDIKFGDDDTARKYTGAAGYFTVVKDVIKEMHRQVGDLIIDDTGLAVQGLLVRHLILPNNLAGTDKVLEFLAREISPDTFINLMDQYYPAFKASKYEELNRRITPGEFREALNLAKNARLTRIYT